MAFDFPKSGAHNECMEMKPAKLVALQEAFNCRQDDFKAFYLMPQKLEICSRDENTQEVCVTCINDYTANMFFILFNANDIEVAYSEQKSNVVTFSVAEIDRICALLNQDKFNFLHNALIILGDRLDKETSKFAGISKQDIVWNLYEAMRKGCLGDENYTQFLQRMHNMIIAEDKKGVLNQPTSCPMRFFRFIGLKIDTDSQQALVEVANIVAQQLERRTRQLTNISAL